MKELKYISQKIEHFGYGKSYWNVKSYFIWSRGSIHSKYWAHWGRVTHIRVSKLGLHWFIIAWPNRHQAIIWTNAGSFLIGPLGTNLNELWTNIQPFSCKIMNLKNAVCKCTAVLVRPQCYVFEIALVWVICKSFNSPCYDLIHGNWEKQSLGTGHG